MNVTFFNSIESEWLKRKRSAASWLIILGGLFIPLIVLIARMTNFDALYKENSSEHAWEIIFYRAWNIMAAFLLPMCIILTTSLVAQLEYKNNAWKQLFTTPQSMTTIFFSKYFVILFMLLQFFLIFNIGIYLATILPSLFYRAVPYPHEAFPFWAFFKNNFLFFIDSLPIIAFQYLFSLRFKNFLVPVGVGLAMFVASIVAVNWKYGYTFPYTYCIFNYIKMEGRDTSGQPFHIFAILYFLVFLVVSYVIYMRKNEKG